MRKRTPSPLVKKEIPYDFINEDNEDIIIKEQRKPDSMFTPFSISILNTIPTPIILNILIKNISLLKQLNNIAKLAINKHPILHNSSTVNILTPFNQICIYLIIIFYFLSRLFIFILKLLYSYLLILFQR